MHILINAVSAKMGGAANYIREIAKQVAKLDSAEEFIFLVPSEHATAIQSLVPGAQVISSGIAHASSLKRLWFDQVQLPRLVRQLGVDVLFSTANIGCLFCSCRQVLLVRNSQYFSEPYREKVLPEQSWKMRCVFALKKWIVCASAGKADTVMTPSKAIVNEMKKAVRIPESRLLVNHYGVNKSRFSRSNGEKRQECTLLFTSLYTEHKNLGTLMRAVQILANSGWKGKLLTTADPAWEGPAKTKTRAADARLFDVLRERGQLEFAGVMRDTSELYKKGDIFVYPSVVESFGHPLVEAMAAGLPVVAADTEINRELCADAALYFSPFDEEDCAWQIRLLLNNPELRSELSKKASAAAQRFSWEEHFENILSACGIGPAKSHLTAMA